MHGLTTLLTRFRFVLGAVVTLASFSLDAWACSCAGPVPTSSLNRGADAVFIGRVAGILRPQPAGPSRVVTNADGTFTISSTEFSLASQVRFVVERAFKGTTGGQVTLNRNGSSCDYPFVENETYLVFAVSVNGALEAGKCSRPLPLAQATESVKYLEGLRSNRPQALLYGLVHQRGRDQAGNAVVYATSDRFVVRAESAGILIETATQDGNAYELVLPPGKYRILLMRNGQSVSEPVTLQVAAGESLQLLAAAE